MFLHALHGENTLIQAKLEPLPPVSEKKVTQCPWALNVSQISMLTTDRNSPRVYCMV